MTKPSYKNRVEANKELLNRMSDLLGSYPDTRFNQLLIITGITLDNKDQFNEESTETLERFMETYNRV